MSDPESNWPDWIDKAEDDILCIDNNLSARHVPWGIVAFHAQQSAEKMLKALLVYHLQPVRRTHDLVSLLEECIALDPAVQELRSACQRLNAFAFESRYPGDFPEISERQGRECAVLAREVHDSVRGRLPDQPSSRATP